MSYFNRMEINASVQDYSIPQSSRRLLDKRIRISSAVRPPPPKTTVAALFMLVAGSIFLCSGLYIYFADLRAKSDRGLAMVVLGLLSKHTLRYPLKPPDIYLSPICPILFHTVFTPGSYASFILWGAYRGWPGYDYSQIPSYDDD
jgi:hypothetical protein